MHRSAALALLQTHRAFPLSRLEGLAVDETVAFIQTHPDCLLRSCLAGHLTGSAWIVSQDGQKVLLTHHRKLDKWLQLGGHADGDGDLLAVALREAREESGLLRVRTVSGRLFDLDRHWIPARGTEPAHWHHDFRFLFEADASEPLAVSHESKAVSWVKIESVSSLNPEESMIRMVRKTLARRSPQ